MRSDQSSHSTTSRRASVARAARAAQGERDSAAITSERKRRYVLLQFLVFCLIGTLQLGDIASDASAAASYFGLGTSRGSTQFSVPGLRVPSEGTVDVLYSIGDDGRGNYLRLSNATLAALIGLGEGAASPPAAAALQPSIVTEGAEMGTGFDVFFALHTLLSIGVSAVAFHRLFVVLRHLWGKYSALGGERSADEEVEAHTTAGSVRVMEKVITDRAMSKKELSSADELHDEFETEELRLSYRRAAMAMFVVEDLPSVGITFWRLLAVASVSSIRLSNWSQGLLMLQLATSFLMTGMRVANLSHYLKDDNEQRKTEAFLADVVAKTKSALDGFVGVLATEIKHVLRVRHVLWEELQGLPRDVGGDLMILRHVRAAVAALAGARVNEEQLVVRAANRVNVALQRRAEIGAGVVRERILREDLSFDTLPEEGALQIAFPHNMRLGDNLVQFEAWGRADVQVFEGMWNDRESGPESTAMSRLGTAWLYRLELQNMLLDVLARRSAEVPHVTLLIDVGGITTAHATLIGFLRMRRGLAEEVYPDCVRDVLVANISQSGAALRVLEQLELPERAVFVGDTGQRVGTRRRLVKRATTRVSPAENGCDELAAECRQAIGIESDEALKAWCGEACAAELELYEDNGPEWTEVEGVPGVRIEVKKLPDFTCRLHRFRVRLVGVKASTAFRATSMTIGTPQSATFGDRGVLDQKELARLSSSAGARLIYQAGKTPRGLSNRHFVMVAFEDSNHNMLVSRDLRASTRSEAFMAKFEREHLPKGLVLGRARNYGFRFRPTSNDLDCIFEALICIAPGGNFPSRAMNADVVSISLAKGVRGIARAIEVLARSIEETYVDIDMISEPVEPHETEEPSLAPDLNGSILTAKINSDALPRRLGGSLALGDGGLCCAGVVHEPISHTLGRAVLLRTLEGVSEVECEGVGAMMEALETGESGAQVELKALPPHVGGEVVLLRRLRERSGDVGAAISKFAEALELRATYGFDAAFADIVETHMGFSEVPGHAALLRVWPHNWDLGRTEEGDVVRYERWGAIDVDGMLREFPLEDASIASVGDDERAVQVEEWVEALERDAGVDISVVLRDFDTEVRSKVEEVLDGVRAHAARDRDGAALPRRVQSESGASAWRTLRGGPSEVVTECRVVAAVSKLRQYRHVVELPAEILGEPQRAEDWFGEALASLRSKASFLLGDRGVERVELLADFDEAHGVFWQTAKMPPGVTDRDFVALAFADRERLALTNRFLVGEASDALANRALGLHGDREASLVRGRALLYGFAFQQEHGRKPAMVFYEHIEPLGSVPAKLVNLDRVGVGRAKGVRGMARALVAARTASICAAQASQVEATLDPDGEANAKNQSAVSFRQNLVYRIELQAMLLDRLSRSQRRVAMAVNLFDVAGLTMNHRRAVPYLLEEARLAKATGSMVSVFLVAAVKSVATAIWTGMKRLLPSNVARAVKLLNTSGSSLRAREARGELTRYVPLSVLPRSLGGAAAFGDGGHCCTGFAQPSFLRKGGADLQAEAAARLLEAFANVRPGELEAVRRLAASEEVGDELREQPAHVGGGVALLRLVRNPGRSAIERARKMLDLRQEHGSAAKYEEICTQGLSLHTLPGSAELREATWQTNEWIGVDARGDVVVFERWGAIETQVMMDMMPVEAYARWDAYRWEARAMVLDALSRRARRVVRFANVIDARGTSFEHRKLLSYGQEFSAGLGGRCVPPRLWSATFIVRVGKGASLFIRLLRKTGIIDNIHSSIHVVTGDDAFTTASEFAARFGRQCLPASVGGSLLEVGSDAHCYAELPAASDVDALWERYELQVSPAAEGSEEAMRTLASFVDVMPAERSEVRRLLRDEVGAALLQQPPHIGGCVALVRLVRDPALSAIDRACKMLVVRRELGSAAMHLEIRDQGLSLHTLPGSAELRDATWQTNEWIGVDARGDVVVFERWGAIEPQVMMDMMPVEAYARWDAYRWEARAMVLDVLSRRARRVVRFANVIDVGGTTFGHRKLLRWFKEFAVSATIASVPDLRSTTDFIRANHAMNVIFNSAKKVGVVNEQQRVTTFVNDAPSPFASSTDFAARFRRHALPASVGGSLGDAHCSMELPAVSDADALWERYEVQVSRSVDGCEDCNNRTVESFPSVLQLPVESRNSSASDERVV